MRILDAAMGAAWAMEEAALRQLLEIAAREHEITPEALQAYRAQAMEKGEKAKVRDGVAIIGAEGPMFKRANLMTELCGATSYDVLMRDFQAALDDGNIRAILFNIDSPGGEAAGCAELAAAIAAARGTKPIIAYAGDLMASAAYWVGSAADRIVIGKSAAVGSIGVRASIADTSARDARSGVQRFDFVSSQSPYKVADPKTDEGAARLQARVDSLAKVFVDTVASHRDVSAAHVLDAFGKGDVLIGQAAVDAGMADGLGTFESTLAEIIKSFNPRASIGFSPAALHGPATPPAARGEVDIAFEAVRKAALVRIAVEEKTQAEADAARVAKQREDDSAVAAILGVMGIVRGNTPSQIHSL